MNLVLGKSMLKEMAIKGGFYTVLMASFYNIYLISISVILKSKIH